MMWKEVVMIDFDNPPESNNLLSSLIGSKDVVLNTTNEVCNCLEPVIITNPVLKQLLYVHGNYTYDGKLHIIPPRNRRLSYEFFPKTYFHPRGIGIDDLSKYFVTDFTSGETFPMYLAVGCGHCDICKSSKVDSFAVRCELESQCYSSLPYFITLTYSDMYYPKLGPSVQDAQLFIKRLRARLDYYGFGDSFRYVVCSEYGHNTHRGHLHMLVWNLYPFKGVKYFRLKQFVRRSWGKGHIYMSIVSPNYIVKGSGHHLSKPEKCFQYVAKYICKDCYVPEGMNKPFFCTSRRRGGIGAPFLDRNKLYIRKNKIIEFAYLDRFSQKVKSIPFVKYNLNRLFPSFSQSVPLELRNAVKDICAKVPFVKNGVSLVKILREDFGSLFWPLHRLDDLPSSYVQGTLSWLSCPGARSLFYHNLAIDVGVLVKWKRKGVDLDSCKKLHDLRILVCSELGKRKKLRYLVPKARTIKRYRELAQQREVF